MSVGKTCDDGTISIFTQSGISIHKEQDVLITCKGEPLYIGECNKHGHKKRGIFTKVYNIGVTIFANQTRKLPHHSQVGNH
ncbi:hypothetical protein ACHAW6_000043 [Cyclotella cf. meneghiniana]